jgi:serine/threonine protein kinase
MTLSPGDILDKRYRIVELLGKGGFGAVYRAWNMNLKGPCAVKENTETTEAAQQQFAREASMLFNLKHPNLPRVFDTFSVLDQGQYLVMDYVEGENLEDILKRTGGPLDESQLMVWVGQICDALSYMHSQEPPIIHRDLKPANIRITPAGQAMLVDFGIAKVYDPSSKTTAGARAMTPGFSPPEQYGRGLTDAQSDIYALGATIYTLLTARVPPESLDLLTNSKPPPLPARMLNPKIAPNVSDAIARAMQLEKSNRFATVSEFKAALETRSAPSFINIDPVKAAAKREIMDAPTPASLSASESQGAPAAQQPKKKNTCLTLLIIFLVLSCCVVVTFLILFYLYGDQLLEFLYYYSWTPKLLATAGLLLFLE